MTIFVINQHTESVDAFYEGDEMWLPSHPLDNSEDRLVIKFDRNISDLKNKRYNFVLSANSEHMIDFLFITDNIPCFFKSLSPKQVAKKIADIFN